MGLHRRDLSFIFLLWLATRAIVFGAASWTTGSLHNGIESLTAFDGGWYSQIILRGYSYAPDGAQYDIAFFPLYPAAAWVLVHLGLTFTTASLLLSNAAFLAALFVTYRWIARRADRAAGRWAVATLCCSPLSLFCSAAYAESSFLLFSALALLSFDRAHTRRTVLWTALASLTRLQGIAFLPAFALTAIARRSRAALLPALAALTGIACMSAYCAVRFGDPLAYVHAQSGWRRGVAFDETAWQNLLGAGVATAPWLHLLALGAVVLLIALRRRLPSLAQTVLWLCALLAERVAWNGSEYVFLFTLVAIVLAIASHETLGIAAVAYALAGIGLIAAAGPPISVDRLAYSLLPTTVALALLSRRVPALGFAVLAIMLVDLGEFTVRFAQQHFVA